ncbi:MAG: glycosyltransferase, partial [Planctomycetes bacterium]|nr:glycosyltransferase [Planctomycetota bacterium]
GEVDEETRAALLCKAFAAVQPSLYEGFNLGLLEAMAAGLPLVCSRIPAHEEVGGDGVSYFAPDSADELAQALEEAVFDENRRRELSKKGQMRAERFSWQTSAAQLREIWFAEER